MVNNFFHGNSNNISSTQLLTNFIKYITKSIYDQISNINYPNENYLIPRHNHGGANHMRQLLYGILCINKVNKYNNKLYNSLIKLDDTEILNDNDIIKRKLALVIVPLFKSLARIAENDAFNTDLTLKKTDKSGTINKLYNLLIPNDNYNILKLIFKQIIITEYSYVGAVIYKILMNKILNPNNNDKNIESYINVLSLSSCYYYSTYDNDKHNINFNRPPILHKFILLHALSNMGHYMDHCRGGYTRIFNGGKYNMFLHYLFNNKTETNDITKYKKEMELIVINTIINTYDFNKEYKGTISCTNYSYLYNYKTKNYTYNHINLHTTFDKLFEIVFGNNFNNGIININITHKNNILKRNTYSESIKKLI